MTFVIPPSLLSSANITTTINILIQDLVLESLVFARSSINVSSVKESYNDDTYLEIAFDIVLIAKLYYFPVQGWHRNL